MNALKMAGNLDVIFRNTRVDIVENSSSYLLLIKDFRSNTCYLHCLEVPFKRSLSNFLKILRQPFLKIYTA